MATTVTGPNTLYFYLKAVNPDDPKTTQYPHQMWVKCIHREDGVYCHLPTNSQFRGDSKYWFFVTDGDMLMAHRITDIKPDQLYELDEHGKLVDLDTTIAELRDIQEL